MALYKTDNCRRTSDFNEKSDCIAGETHLSTLLDLPDGGIRKGETVEDAARREAAKEIGANLGNLKLVGVYTNFCQHKNDHVVVLSCDDFALTGKTDHEIERFDFFPFDGLPTDVSPGSPRRIREYANSAGSPLLGLW